MFKFNGISSIDMGVIVEEESLFLVKAPQRYENTIIDGKDGSLFNELGYSNVDIPMTIQIMHPDKMDSIFSWLNGPGIFEYNGRICNAYFYNDISPKRLASIRTADVTFSRCPFWKNKDDEYLVCSEKVYNEGNIYSQPIIRLEKGTSNSVDITISDVRFIYNFNADEEYVEIDCEKYYASYENLNRNRNLEIDFQFPKLFPGENKIFINSGDAIVKIKSKDRWL